jgi:alpha-N-arabinofuranosidase
MISEGGTETGHTVTIARSESPWGPFESCPHNPIFTNRNQPYSNPVQNTGHGDLIQDGEGKWWMIHLAVRNLNKHHHLGRETFLAPVDFDKDGWPIVNRDGVAQIEMFAISPGKQEHDSSYKKYRFRETKGPEWNYIRNPDKDNYNWDTKAETLGLYPSEYSLEDIKSPTFLGIRQKDFNIEVSTMLRFDPQENGEEAGITAFATPEHFYSVGLKRENGQNYVVASMKIGQIKHHSSKMPFKSENIFLKIRADQVSYYLYYSENGEDWKLLGKNFTRLLSSETAGTFTGVYLGMYATGNGKSTRNPATFHHFNYQKYTE